ncbi:MAG: hybrid sensor histidine kinase/response regulator [Bdellovibrionota bacterium]
MQKPFVLCVDDEIDNLEALERVFRKKYNVLKASSGPEALQLLQSSQETIALIITDQRMPEMTGVELLQEVQKLRPETMRILLTGYTDLESVITAINDGQIYRYLTKPWDPVDLVQTVDSAVEKYYLRHELQEKNRSLEAAYLELQSLDKAKSNFMILINHELKTPLTSILNFTYLLQDTAMSDEQKSYLQKVSNSSEKLKKIIDDVLLIMRSETGKVEAKKQTIKLEHFLGSMRSFFEKQMEKKSVTLKLDLQVKEIVSDETFLSQVFSRVIHNAIKFSTANSEILVRSQLLGTDKVRIDIKNVGPSIQEGAIEKIFKPFHLEENVLNHSQGMGLGLSICQTLLKHLGSGLQVKNLPDGVIVSFDLSAENVVPRPS